MLKHSKLLSVTYSEEEPTEESNSGKAVGGAALGGTAESGSGGEKGEKFTDNCYEIMMVLIMVNGGGKGITPDADPDPEWEVDSWWNTSRVGGAQIGCRYHICKKCVCYTSAEIAAFKIKASLEGMSEGIKFEKHTEKGSGIFAGYEIKKLCSFWLEDACPKPCPCDGSSDAELIDTPGHYTNQGFHAPDRDYVASVYINSFSTEYEASDGTTLTFSKPGNMKSVIEEIIDKERDVDIGCKGKKGGDPPPLK